MPSRLSRIVLSTLALSATLSTTFSITLTSHAENSIVIGGVFALTGDESSLDLPAANGAKLAAKEINAAGGVLGHPISFVVRDTKYQMDVTAEVTTQLIAEDKSVAIIGYTDSDSALASAPIAQAAKIPVITAGATSPKLPEQIGDYLFMACFGDNVQAAAGAEYSFKNFGKTAYLLKDSGIEYTNLLAAYFKARFTELGGKIALEDEFDDQTKDFSVQIAKLKALPTQPDFYYISAMPYNAGLLAKQLRAAGFTAPIIGGDGYDTPDILTDAGAAAENVYFTTHGYMNATDGTDPIQKFMMAYKSEYGHDAENVFAALGYDSMYLLVDAIKRAGSTDSVAIKTALEQTQNFAAISGTISFSSTSHIPQKVVTVIRVKGGKFTLAAQLSPEKVPSPDTGS
jgi:branched-chain amino acid transport system substrate-binding protein